MSFFFLPQTHSCLPARFVAADKTQCHRNDDCKGTGIGICVIPVTSNSSRFIKISHARGQDVLFVGNPYELLFHGKYSTSFNCYTKIDGIRAL